MKVVCSPSLLLAICLAICLATSAQAESITYPANANDVNVKEDLITLGIHTSNAAGNGTTDDTAAIQAALTWIRGKSRILYFPNGTYRVTDKMTLGSDLSKSKYTFLQGQSEAGTILKLDNNAVGFDSAATPKPVLTFFEGTSTGQAFRNSICNMTIDTGSGNLGAIGLQYTNSNTGTVRDITIKSSDANKVGIIGLDLSQNWAGPALFKRVTVIGFNTGIKTNDYIYSNVFEDLVLKNQKVEGILNTNNIYTIHRLTSTNTVPVVRNTSGSGRISIINSSFSGGASANAAIVNFGPLYLRNVTQSGYGTFVDNSSPVIRPDVAGTTISEYTSHTVKSVFNSTERMLNLPIEDYPEPLAAALSNWQAVDGAASDDTAAIQAAMNSGKSTIYFPQGDYVVSDTIIVSGNVRRILGLQSKITAASTFLNQAKPVFKFENINGTDVTIEGIATAPYQGETSTWNDDFYWIEQATSKALVIDNFTFRGGKPYRNSAANCKVYVNDATSNFGWIFSNGCKAWLRQFNPEAAETKAVVDNADVWMLGLKTEGWGTNVEVRNGGRLEILGGLIYPTNTLPTVFEPAFIVNNAQATLGFIHGIEETYYPVFVRETRGAVTRDFVQADASRNVNYFVARPAPAGEVIVDNLDTEATASGTWTSSTSVAGYHRTNYVTDGNANKGTKTFRFRPNLPSAGTYDVYMRWVAGTTHSSITPVDVAYNGGTDALEVNQRLDGEEWVLLGSYPFSSGTGGNVLVSTTGTDGFVIADAAKFVAPSSGSISVGTPGVASGSYNFTTLGTQDWVAWGRTALTSLDRKATGGSKLSDWTAVGTGHSRTSNSAVSHTWTDGTPTASATSTAFLKVGGVSSGFEFTAQATATLRTLKLYTITQSSGTGQLEVSLDDGSATTEVITIPGGSALENQLVTIQYKAAGNSLLRVRWTNETGTGVVGLRGAYLE